MFGVSYHAVLRAIHRGDLQAERVFNRLQISAEALDAYRAANRVVVIPPSMCLCRKRLYGRRDRPGRRLATAPGCARSKGGHEHYQTQPVRQCPVRWRDGGRGTREQQRTFKHPASPGQPTALAQARAFSDELDRRKRLGGVVDLDRGRVTLAVFVETYWQLHAVPNLAAATRDVYAHVWEKHLRRRVGDRQLHALTAGHVVRLRSDLEQAGVGAPTVRKALAFLQGVLAFAIVEGHVDLNPVAVVSKPKDVRQRTPHVFMPPQVEEIRDRMDLVDAALVSVLAYAGPRPEEALRLQLRDVGAHAIRFDGRKTGGRERFTPLLAPLASDLRELKLATGRRSPSSPVFAAHDGQHWQPDDYRNWRRRVWQGWVGGDTTSATCVHAGDRVCKKCGAVRCTPLGSRPRDLRGSYVTLRAYEGVPLTTIGKEVGGSVAMLDRHYAGVLANWHGKLTPAVDQIAAARAESRLRQEAP
jgi:integrase